MWMDTEGPTFQMLDHILLINDMTSIHVYKLIFMDPRKIGGDECQSIFVVI